MSSCTCGHPLRSLPHPADGLATWLRCLNCGRWWTAAGVELHRAPTEPPAGQQDEVSLAPEVEP